MRVPDSVVIWLTIEEKGPELHKLAIELTIYRITR